MSVKAAKLGLEYRIVLKDKEGNLKFDSETQKARCFTRNFLIMLVGMWWYDGSSLDNFYEWNGQETQGAVKSNWDATNYFTRIDSVAGNPSDLAGIAVGTDDTPESIYDIRLFGFIRDGTDPTELDYQTPVHEPVAVDGNDTYWTIYRDFINSSGASITVNEIGMMFQCDLNEYGLLARDVPTSIVVANGDTLRVYYTWRTSI